MLLILILISIRATKSLAAFRVVDECPTSEEIWKNRSRLWDCNEEDGYFYHCILNNEGDLVESCLPRKKINSGADGCPSVSIHGNQVYHAAKRTDCPQDNMFCPMSSLSYYTNQLYRYPICYRNALERANFDNKDCNQGQLRGLQTRRSLRKAAIEKVNSCPTSKSTWRTRSSQFRCPEKNGYFYHCILDNSGTLIESCLPKKIITAGSDGCPSVSIHGKQVYHAARRTDCPVDNIFCPTSLEDFYSDQLYYYPICYQNVSKRVEYGGENCDKGHIPRQELKGTSIQTGDDFMSFESARQIRNSEDGVLIRTGLSLINAISTCIVVLVKNISHWG